MKRLVIIISAVAILGIIAPGVTALAQPIRTPHENPATAIDSLDEAALLFHYSLIINLAAIQQYEDARQALEEIKKVDVPDELRYIFNLYNDLYRQLFITLDNIETTLDEASVLIVLNQTSQARKRLENAGTDIQYALFLLEDIEAATDALRERLGFIVDRVTNQFREAYGRLKGSVVLLRQLVDKLNSLRQSLTERYIQITGLVPTELSLRVTPESVFVGDSITASGMLSGGGSPLAHRNLEILLDKWPISTVTTSNDGSYAVNITIPYQYTRTMTLASLYQPLGDDIETYLASQSPPVMIQTMFYPTQLEVTAPPSGHPGLPINVSGEINSNNSHIERTIRVLLDDTRLTEAVVSGHFNVEITLPADTSPGERNLTVIVSPLGRYAGISETKSINITTLPIYVDAQMPSFILLPESVQVNGTVSNEFGPLADAGISLNYRDSSSTVRTSQDGSFTASLEAPLDLSFIGQQEIILDIKPLEPWAAATRVQRQVLTINPVNTGLILVILIAIAILIYTRSRTKLFERKVIPLEEPAVIPVPVSIPIPRPRLTGIKGRILSAYWLGIKIIAGFSGINMAPHVTLREFLKMTASILPIIARHFAELTAMAEKALYSNNRPHKGAATNAENTAATIEEELYRGTS